MRVVSFVGALALTNTALAAVVFDRSPSSQSSVSTSTLVATAAASPGLDGLPSNFFSSVFKAFDLSMPDVVTIYEETFQTTTVTGVLPTPSTSSSTGTLSSASMSSSTSSASTLRIVETLRSTVTTRSTATYTPETTRTYVSTTTRATQASNSTSGSVNAAPSLASSGTIASSNSGVTASESLASGVPATEAGDGPKSFINESFLLAITTNTAAPSLATPVATPRTTTEMLSFIQAPSSTSTKTPVVTLAVATQQGSNSSSTTTPARPLATGTSCGESGNFTLTWDDEPSFTPSKNDTAVRFPPVFNPYHHLFFANGYSYITDGSEPYPSLSEPTLAVWIKEITGNITGSPGAGITQLNPGEIGAGPRNSIDAYWFNAYDAYFGCLNNGPGDCQLLITGYVWDEYNNIEMPGPNQITAVPTCPDYKNCKLLHVKFDAAIFHQLSGIQFQMYTVTPNGALDWQDFVVDNLSMGWWNNSCEAGLLRISQRK